MSYSPTLGRFLELDPIGSPNIAPSITASKHVMRAGDALNAVERARRKTAALFGRKNGSEEALWKYADGMNLYQFVGSNPVNFSDPSGLQKWYQGWGRTIGMAVGYYDGTSELWSGAADGYVQGSYGAVGALSGGLLDSDYGFFGYKDEVGDWLENGGWGDIDDSNSGYGSGETGGRVLVACTVAAAGVKVAGLEGFNIRLAIHAPHAGGPHKYWHFQANWWTQGVKGSGGVFRLP